MRRAVVLAVMAATGCGSSVDPPTSSLSEQDIIQAAGLQPDGGSWRTASGCEVSAILVGEGRVRLYEDAGSAVAKAPDGDSGVELHTATDACREEIEQALSGA